MSENKLLKPEAIQDLEKQLKIEIVDGSIDKERENYFIQNESGEVIELRLFGINRKYVPKLSAFKALSKLALEFSSFSNLTSLISLGNLRSLSLVGSATLEHIWEVGLNKNLKFLDISGTNVWDLSPLYNLLKDDEFVLEFNPENIIYPPLKTAGLNSRNAIIGWFEKHRDLVNSIIDDNIAEGAKSIDLGFCGITDLSLHPKLFECKHLEELILSNEWASYVNSDWDRIVSKNRKKGYPNNIFRIPNKIKKLTNLKRLYIGGDWKSDSGRNWNRWRIQYFRIFTRLTNLSYLNVSNNVIDHIYDLHLLPSLITLHANNNLIKDIKITQELPALKELFLSNNNLQDVSFLNLCPNLTTVDLHSNSLKNLNSIRGLINKLSIQDTKWSLGTISVAHNKTLRLPTLDVIANGRSAVIDYFNRWEQEQELDLPLQNNSDIKVILVGNSGVGKSTLAEWLSKGVVNPKQSSTHWFSRMTWKETINNRAFNLRVFDFGGQEYYHDTHHLFFTQDTIYVLLWDKNPHDLYKLNVNPVNELIDYPIEYWLDSISYFIKKRKIAKDEAKIKKLVLEKGRSFTNIATENSTTTDQDTSNNAGRHTLVFQSKVDTYRAVQFLDQEKLFNKYNWIADFANFSVLEQRGITQVKDKILELVNDMSVIQNPLLATWAAIKNHIERNGTKRRNSLTVRKFQNYCNKIIKQMPELDTASDQRLQRLKFDRQNTLNFINHLATVGLLLHFPENKSLSGKVFINQNFLIKHIHSILLKIASEKGIIKKSDIIDSRDKDLKVSDVQSLLELMIHFKIIFQHPTKIDQLIAPLYLPSKPLKAIQLFLTQFKKPLFRYQFKGFIHRFVVLEFFSSFGSKILTGKSDVEPYYFWGNGVVLKDDLTSEIVLISFENSNESKEYKGYIDLFSLTGKKGKFIDEILSELDKITFDRNVDKAVCASDGQFIPIKELNYAAQQEHFIFKYAGSYYKLVDFKEFLDKPLKMKNLFISYSKNDLTMVDEFKKHLSALQRDGKVGHWYCTELVAGEEWNDSISRHFDESDIICFMVSPNFMHTDYIFEYEIKKAFERKQNDQPFKIVPIILDFCRWTTEKYNLGIYTALPFMAKPVSDFANRNMAWYIVEEALRVMIDDGSVPSGVEFYTSEQLPKDVQEIYRRISRNEVS